MRQKNFTGTLIKYLILIRMRVYYDRLKLCRQQYGFLILLLMLFNCKALIAQEILVSGEASVLANNLLRTRVQYEHEALLMARENAIEKEFGSSVMSNYERLTITEMEGRSVAFNSDKRSNYLNSYPNGIWIKDVNKSCSDEKDEKGNFWYTCKVTGYARKIESASVLFKAFTLDGTDPDLNRSETFTDGESGYLYFKSPENGYIIVFFDDLNTVQRCVPYNNSNDNYFKVEGNREYIFFSRGKCDYLSDKNHVDEIEFYTESPLDYNLFYILFSPEPFSGYFSDPPEKLGGGYTSFRSMARENFHSWLQDNRIRNKYLQVQIIGVSIVKKN